MIMRTFEARWISHDPETVRARAQSGGVDALLILKVEQRREDGSPLLLGAVIYDGAGGNSLVRRGFQTARLPPEPWVRANGKALPEKRPELLAEQIVKELDLALRDHLRQADRTRLMH
jgi:hypothetical protein